jgi:hypothetical protein
MPTLRINLNELPIYFCRDLIFFFRYGVKVFFKFGVEVGQSIENAPIVQKRNI